MPSLARRGEKADTFTALAWLHIEGRLKGHTLAKSKKLPDHTGGISLGSSCFSEDQIIEITSLFGFDESFCLYERLEAAADKYNIFSSSKAPVNEQKVLLEELIKRSKALLTAMSKLGLQETASIAWYLDRVSRKDELQSNLIRYQSAAASALKKLKETTSSGGSPRKFARDWLIKDLIQIYREGLEREPTNAFDHYSKGYHGPFFEFIQYCFDCIGISMKENTLGRELSKVIAEKT